MVYFPVRKCYHAVKLSLLLILVVAVLALFEQWRGGKRGSDAFSDPEEAEFERQILEDEARIVPGMGEGGVAVYLTGEEKKLGQESEKKLAMNVYLSDKIAYNRTLKDHRNPACKRVIYDAELPSASVVLIFHNEPYSVVVRTIWSVINSCRRSNPWYQRANFLDSKGRTMRLGYPGQDPNSPLVYLKEIILVDDNSTLPELKGKLSHYVRTRLPPDLIRILRLPDRVGLTRARLAGARYAAGEVLVFLDSHCETQPDWLRPQLQAIKEDPHAVLVPIIDVIDASNFYYSVQDPVTFQGLMQARIVGARAARGDVLIFLDAHCEGEADWLRPLLQRVRHKRDSVVTPVIDVIDQSGFQIEASDTFQVGGFTFTGHFTWIDVPEREKKRRGSDISPTWSPTMAGGLFAINRAYYWELGAYDEQMAGWGGENLEMSFRIWQCGGTLETIPCSRVGHVFRSFHPYGLPAHTDTHGINTARMAEVWMDEYAELFYMHRPDLRNSPKIGDVTHRKVLREKLQCKSFQWYLDNIYKEKFVPVRDAYGYGRFLNEGTGLCLDTLQREAEDSALGLYQCHRELQATQYLVLSLNNELRGEDDCAHAQYHRRNSVESHDESRKVLMSTCHGKQREQKWSYLPVSRQIRHTESGLCLDAGGVSPGGDVVLRACADTPHQRWRIDYSEDNDFRVSDDIEQSEQQRKLGRLRGQKRKSRSLLSYSGSNLNSLPNGTIRRHTHKKHRKRSKKNKKTKNKFILKLVRSLANRSDEHLELDIHCKHKQLYPNNTFVRDLVTILNDKNIKVINNGRIFERNKVTQLEGARVGAAGRGGGVGAGGSGGGKEAKVLNKLDIVEQQAPPAIPDQKQSQVTKKSRKKPKPPQPAAPPLSSGASPLTAPSPPSSSVSRTEPRAHRIIIEDFVELSPDNTVRPKRLKKRKRKRVTPLPVEQRGGAARAQELPPQDEAINSLPPLSAEGGRESSGEDAMAMSDAERRTRTSGEQPYDEIDEPRAQHNATPWRRHRHQVSHGDDSGDEIHMRAESTAAPVKVVMRSNLTFNLGDEFFQWRGDRADGDAGATDLSIPSARAAPPAHAWLLAPPSRSGDSPPAPPPAPPSPRPRTHSERDSEDDSSTSDSSSSSEN